MVQITFRALQLGDKDGLDIAQRIMARENYAFAFNYDPSKDFTEYLQFLDDKLHGRNLQPGSVPSTFEVGLVDDRIAARLSVRHALNDFLLQQGGHIGYATLPEFRHLGLGFASLRRGLEITSGLGINPTLVTCDDDNPVSRHLIEKAGGRYESSYIGPDLVVPVRRYWFEES